jgi:hypothetical protein
MTSGSTATFRRGGGRDGPRTVGLGDGVAPGDGEGVVATMDPHPARRVKRRGGKLLRQTGDAFPDRGIITSWTRTEAKRLLVRAPCHSGQRW